MFDSLIRSLGRLLRQPLYNTTVQFMSQVQRRDSTGALCHAWLSPPNIDALLTLAQGYSMVHCDISSACKLFTFMHV